MIKASLISQCLLLAASVVLRPSTSVFAYPAMSPQERTKTFYDALDTEQKTIFDLFWTVMHQRNAGYGSWQMPMHCSPMDSDKDETNPQ